MANYRCRKCRSTLFRSDSLIDSHGHRLLDDRNENDDQIKSKCDSDTRLLFVDERQLPDWIREQIDAAEWTKGRITCGGERCGARIGSFNFIGAMRCACAEQRLPSIQIIRGKVDEPNLHRQKTIPENEI